MNKKKIRSKFLVLLLAALMFISAIPLPALAAPASDIPSEMLNNVYLDALAYTGYNVQAQKNDGSIFVKYSSQVSASIRSNITYGTGPSGLETVSKSGTATGLAPNIATFEANGLCCASYVSYVYYNYMPNIAGIDTSSAPCPTNSRSATAYNTQANSWISAGQARRIAFTQSSDGGTFSPAETIPVGSLIIYKEKDGTRISHVAIYAGYYAGKHFVTHTGNSRGPEFSTVTNSSKGDSPNVVAQVVVPQFVESYGAIEVQKKDTDGKGLAGAYFVATSTKDSNLQFLIGPTNSRGYAISNERIPYGTYTCVETIFPTNYRSYGQTQWSVTVNAANNGVASFTAVNELIPGNIKIAKESEDGKIDGIKFNISGNGVNKDVTSAADGTITTQNLKPGTYTVTEFVKDGYVPQEPQTVTVVSGGTSVVNFNNLLQRGHLIVTKTCEDNLTEGLTFRINGTSTTGQEINIYAITDTEGKATFTDVPVGTYRLTEESTPARYVIPEPQTVEIHWQETTEVSMHNVLKKWNADFYKLDAEHRRQEHSAVPVAIDDSDDSGFPYGYSRGDATLEGAVYGVYQYGELVKTYTTDKKGHFVTDYFICGDGWTIQEISPSPGYLLDDNIYYMDAYPENYSIEYNTIYRDVSEVPIKSNIVLVKHTDDGSTQIETPEEDAEFIIWLKSAGSYENAIESERDYIIIDKHGFGISKELPYGTYIVEQISGKEGFEMLPSFEVFIQEHAEIYSYIINNAPITALIDVVKKDATTGKVIPADGIGFKVRDLSTGKFITQHINYPTPMDIDIFYTNNEGRLRLPEVLGYGEYELIEQTVGNAYGYVLDTTPVKFTVDGSSKIVVVEKSNVPQMGTITIEKQGEAFASVTEQNGIYTPVYEMQGLEGAVFGVYALEDIITLEGTLRHSAGDKVTTLTTSADGIATSNPLFLGKYELREEQAPYGMVLLDEPIQIELTYAGEHVAITTTSTTAINERQKVCISLLKELEKDEKYGIGFGEEYKNIQFGLYAAESLIASDGTEIPQDGLMEIVTINADGNAVFTVDAPVGSKLYIKEYATDAHYQLSDVKYPVEFAYADSSIATVQINANNGEAIKNTIIRGDVHGLKLDEDNQPIANVLFGLFKTDEIEFNEGTALTTALSDEKGIFSFTDIPYGKWMVRELSCPEEFVLNDELFEVSITENEQIQELTVTNQKVRGKVQVVKLNSKDHNEKLSGAVFELYLDVNQNGIFDIDIDTLYGTLKESELGIYELRDLKYNGYFLFEASAPEGFTKDDRYFYFQIKTNGETVVIENELGVGFTNEPIPVPDESPKTGDPIETFFWIVLASGALTIFVVATYVKIRNRKYRK